MLCAECQNLLSDYLDGDLSERRRAEVDAHVRDCARCAALRNDLARIIHASASLPLHTPSTRVWEGISREIAGESRILSGPRAWWDRLGARRFDFSVSARQLTAAAAAVVVLAGALWAINVASPGALSQGNWGGFGTNTVVTQVPLSFTEKRQEVERLRTAVDDMSRRLDQRQAGWSADLRATYAKSVSDLDVRIGESQKAYDADGTENTRVPLIEALRAKFNALEEFASVK